MNPAADQLTTSSEERSGRHGLFNLPNQLTTLRLALAVVLFFLIAFRAWEIGIVVFSLACVTDWLDGHLARKHNLVSSLGRVYDPLVDKILVLGMLVFFQQVRDTGLRGDCGWNAGMVVVLLAREFLVTGVRGLLEERGVAFGADWLGKAKMGLQCASIYWIFIALTIARSGPPPAFVELLRDVFNWGTVAVTALSGLNYLRMAKIHLA